MPSAVASVVGSVIGGVGANKAAGVQARADAQAVKDANAIQDKSIATETTNAQPYTGAGASAAGRLTAGTAPGGEFTQNFTMADFMANKDPAYDFDFKEGQKALDRSASAHGTLNSGGTMKAAIRYGQGFASKEFGNAYSRFMTTRQNNFSNLATLFNTGANVTNDLNKSIYATGAGEAETTATGGIARGNARAGGVNALYGIPSNMAMMMSGSGGSGGGQDLGNQMPWLG